MVNRLFENLSRGQLRWIELLGIGYLEAQPNGVYDQAYFDKYRGMREGQIGQGLNKFRADLALKQICRGDTVIDVGIGDGAFIDELDARGCSVNGFDINPASIAYLEETARYADLYACRWDVVTFWDSLEHIRDPRQALNAVGRTAIVSIPIFESVEHVLSSKHYRPDEHFWYFTRDGFELFLAGEGLLVTDVLLDEQRLGRDGIETFIAKRIRD